MGFATSHTLAGTRPTKELLTRLRKRRSPAARSRSRRWRGSAGCQAIERCNAFCGASSVNLLTTRAEFGPGRVSNLRWTMGGKHSGAGPAVAVALPHRRAHRGPPRPRHDRAVRDVPLRSLTARTDASPCASALDLRARPQFDGSGMCSDTAMPPRRRVSRDTRPAKMLLRSVASAQQKEVRKASSLTGNLGPHPYQLNAGNRCADRHFPRSRPTVRAKGMRSIGPLVCIQSSR